MENKTDDLEDLHVWFFSMQRLLLNFKVHKSCCDNFLLLAVATEIALQPSCQIIWISKFWIL